MASEWWPEWLGNDGLKLGDLGKTGYLHSDGIDLAYVRRYRLVHLGITGGDIRSLPVRPGPEYKILDAWAGNWVIQGEAKDLRSGSALRVYWTLKGKWILGGFFLKIRTTWKAQGTIRNGLVVTGYDLAKKACFTQGYNDDGSWLMPRT